MSQLINIPKSEQNLTVTIKDEDTELFVIKKLNIYSSDDSVVLKLINKAVLEILGELGYVKAVEVRNVERSRS